MIGVWTWRGKYEQGELAALSDWESVALKDRETYIGRLGS